MEPRWMDFCKALKADDEDEEEHEEVDGDANHLHGKHEEDTIVTELLFCREQRRILKALSGGVSLVFNKIQ